MATTAPETQTVKSKRLAGKVVLVTGGSRGIGAGIALRLANEGAQVAISYQKSKSAADEVVARMSKENVRAAAFQADAADAQQSQALIEKVVKEFGKLDILVNNAGVFELQPLAELTVEHFDRIFDVNVRGVVSTTAAAVKKMSDGGRVITISSVAATKAMPGASVYSATKAALNTLTRIWAQELGQRKITVNNVAPGTTASDMFDTVPKEMQDQMVAKTALGRIGQPDDIAAVVAFLASADGGWVTGQTIETDGGITL